MAIAQRTQTSSSKSNGGSKGASTSTQAAASAPARDPVAVRAYEIWLETGRPQGKDQEHWFQAEREVRARKSLR